MNVTVINPINDIVLHNKHISKVNCNPYSLTNFVSTIVDVIVPPQINAVSTLYNYCYCYLYAKAASLNHFAIILYTPT